MHIDEQTKKQIQENQHESLEWEKGKWAHGECDVPDCTEKPRYKLFLPKIYPVPALCAEHEEFREYRSSLEIVRAHHQKTYGGK